MNIPNKTIPSLLAMILLVAAALAVSGCKKDEAAPAAAASEHPAVEKAAEHPDSQPAQANPATAKPKDHPAH